MTFNWKDSDEKNYGLIAQEIEEILPDLVHTKNDEMKTIAYNQLIPILINLLQKQQKQIEHIYNILKNA